jgi:hypothetical protein
MAHGISQCICEQTINPTWIHLLHCAHGGKHKIKHDVIQDFFTSIVKDVGFHVLNERTHVLPISPIWSSQQWMVIVLITNGTHILANVIIFDLICACFVNCLFSKNDYDNYNSSKNCVILRLTPPKDDFIHLAVKMFGNLHQQANNFLHWCANMAWLMKGTGSSLLLIIHSFYRQRGVSGSLKSSCHHYLTLGNYDNKRNLF